MINILRRVDVSSSEQIRDVPVGEIPSFHESEEEEKETESVVMGRVFIGQRRPERRRRHSVVLRILLLLLF